MMHMKNYSNKTVQQRPVFNMPSFFVNVKEIGKMVALVDTGATGMCLIRKDCLTEAINIIPSNVECIQVNGSRVELNLGCVHLTVTLLGRTLTMPFYITEKMEGNVIILGVNWMLEMGISLQSDGTMFRLSLAGVKNKGNEKSCYQSLIQVGMKGVGQVKTFVDTGAGISLVRADTLNEKTMSRMVPTSINVLATNGNKTNVLGSVNLHITYSGKSTLIENVCVLSEMPYPFILGVEWIHKTRVIIQSSG